MGLERTVQLEECVGLDRCNLYFSVIKEERKIKCTCVCVSKILFDDVMWLDSCIFRPLPHHKHKRR